MRKKKIEIRSFPDRFGSSFSFDVFTSRRAIGFLS
jgi:hypothetical protein